MPYSVRQIHETVRTKPSLGRQAIIAPRAMKLARKPNTPGHISANFGDGYLVLHAGESNPAVYKEDELVSEPDAYWRVTHNVFGLPYFKEVSTYADAEIYLQSIDVSSDSTTNIEGPFFEQKTLSEGPMPTLDIYDLLNEEDL
jgi:hypothetical protein